MSTLSGATGNDALKGGRSDDLLDGKAGNDSLRGRQGNDTYLFGLGDGIDTINDYDNIDRYGNNPHTDKLIFKSGLSESDISYSRTGNHLVLSINNSSDQVTIKNWFRAEYYQLQAIEFVDGGSLDVDRIEFDLQQLSGDSADNTLKGFVDDELISGFTGDDKLSGSRGNDTLDGGIGNDTLRGNQGDDIYHFGIGNGNDRINDYNSIDRYGSANSHNDRLIFKSGLTTDDISYSRSGNHLVLTITQTGESITVQNWFRADYYQLQTIEFVDGGALDLQQIANELGHANHSNNDTVNEALTGDSNNNTLKGSIGNDTLDGQAGNDVLRGGQGNDIYLFGLGDGHDTINDSDNIDRFGTDQHIDKLTFKSGLSTGDVSYQRSGNHLVFTLKETQESITVQNWFRAEYHQLQAIEFADGGNISLADINNAATTIDGDSDNNTLKAFSTNDQLSGEEGNDKLYGNLGNDSLDGGLGNDTLVGGEGNDTYRFGIGDGQDRINDYNAIDRYGSHNTHTDKLIFKSGLSEPDISYQRQGNHLVFTINATGETITVQNWFKAGYYQLQVVEFEDGGSIDLSTVGSEETNNNTPIVVNEINDLTALENADFSFTVPSNTFNDIDGDQLNFSATLANGDALPAWLTFNASTSTFYGTPSRFDVTTIEITVTAVDTKGAEVSTAFQLSVDENFDQIVHAADSTYLINGQRSDVVFGTKGNDLIISSEADELLLGDSGHDTYVFSGNFGVDRINNNGAVFDTDTIRFDNIDIENLWFSQQGNDLLITVIGTENQVIVRNWYAQERFQVEEIQVGDQVLFTPGVEALVATMSNHPVPFGTHISDDIAIEVEVIINNVWESLTSLNLSSNIYGDSSSNNLEGHWGNDYLDGRLGNDTLDAGAGNDRLLGGADDDILFGRLGNDDLIGGGGNDQLIGGAGNDFLYGGQGDDVYIFSGDFGQDRINNNDWSGHDIIRFTDDNLSITDILFDQSGNDLDIHIQGSDNQITVRGWYSSNSSREVDQIEVGSSVLSTDKVDALVAGMESYTDNTPLSDTLKNLIENSWETVV